MLKLPFPAPILWPNGRGHWRAKAAQVKKHREWARLATLADNTRPATVGRLILTVYGKPRGPLPDGDAPEAAMKAYRDGISDAYGQDDRTFGKTVVIMGERCEHGSFVIAIEPPAE